MTVQTFLYTGADQTFVVPGGVQSIQVKLWGAGGGGTGGTFAGYSGAGGFVTATIPVNFGDVLTVIVGEGGKSGSATSSYGGGGGGGTDTFSIYAGGSGGGRSAIRLSGTEILTAGGGGGCAGGCTNLAQGGSGGGLAGLKGNIVTSACLIPGCGAGGTQSAGGTGGIGIVPGTNGSQFQGGNGGNSGGINAGGGGGGGGGYYGGGGGAGQDVAGGGCAGVSGAQDCAGGGGSSYISSIALNAMTASVPVGTLTAPNDTDSNYVAGTGIGVYGAKNGGDGLAVFSYTVNPFSINKTVDKSYSDINNTLLYTIGLRNLTGTTIINVTVVDTTPTGTIFDSSSLLLNGNSISGSLNSPGLNIGTMDINGVATLTYKVGIGGIVPSVNPINNSAMVSYDGNTIPFTSNTVTTTISNVTATVLKSTDVTVTTIVNTITYTIVISTTGNTTANNSFLIDTMPEGATFISNSLTLNGVLNPGITVEPPGYNIGTLQPNTINTITFKVSAVSVPTNNNLVNTANLTYAYTVTPSAVNGTTKSIISNVVTIPVVNVDLSGFSKSVDSIATTTGQTLTYTIVVPNKSNVPLLNSVFFDTIPSGVTFVNGSLTVDGVCTTCC